MIVVEGQDKPVCLLWPDMLSDTAEIGRNKLHLKHADHIVGLATFGVLQVELVSTDLPRIRQHVGPQETHGLVLALHYDHVRTGTMYLSLPE